MVSGSNVAPSDVSVKSVIVENIDDSLGVVTPEDVLTVVRTRFLVLEAACDFVSTAVDNDGVIERSEFDTV